MIYGSISTQTGGATLCCFQSCFALSFCASMHNQALAQARWPLGQLLTSVFTAHIDYATQRGQVGFQHWWAQEVATCEGRYRSLHARHPRLDSHWATGERRVRAIMTMYTFCHCCVAPYGFGRLASLQLSANELPTVPPHTTAATGHSSKPRESETSQEHVPSKKLKTASTAK